METSESTGSPSSVRVVFSDPSFATSSLAGATGLRGLAGFGAKSRLRTASILRLSTDLPIVIEIGDRPERIEAFLPELDRLVTEGLITSEPVHVIAYRAGPTTETPGR